MKAHTLLFDGKSGVRIESENLPKLKPNQLRIKTICSAISAGTEMLVYRGQIPSNLPLDAEISVLKKQSGYPMKYGYSLVGEVMQAGNKADQNFIGKKVFCFHPHQDHLLMEASQVIPLPKGIKPEQAVFLPAMETALNLVMDAKPSIGERGIVLGQGVIGLLTTALLANYPLGKLVTLETLPKRQNFSKMMGAEVVLDLNKKTQFTRLKKLLSPSDLANEPQGADLLFELSGQQDGLDKLIALAGYHSRIVIGSWYGTKTSRVHLGGDFHRNRIRIISSQVSTIEPGLRGRWTKKRRIELVWQMIRKIKPERLISHRFQFSDAAEAYKILDTNPEECLQLIFTY